MDLGPPAADQKLNADVPWDAFDPDEYIKHNYLGIQAVDEEILSRVRDHFSDHFRGRAGRVHSGIDVGAGPNLYPALAMLPWCDRITLLERSESNLDYLRRQLQSYDAHWDQFWEVLRKGEAYAELGDDYGKYLAEAVRAPEPGSLFDLCGSDRRWDLGTMFFVAESITTDLDEFRRGVGCFMHVLNPGAPFAAAFMEHSEGYQVGSQEFPALDVDVAEVRTQLAEYADEVTIHRTANPQELVRDGYTGMILACGRRKS
ncbi:MULTISPECIES: SCO2525 family SAM-dependent methyltransferase [unclassified Streptomyces]|uniref:SCO2525 family SAM-dependent methyltransferase n=1 Tax=unclassified Streptomyces TaxID=2593676 RepID=UPI00102BCA5A|nr:SCO2525 family SAM-dependent methyltransferase [Streptomyces sp. BK239]RZU24981.1 NNMT/PNMT/TEMT family protein [Streptomyces sp. BK239]